MCVGEASRHRLQVWGGPGSGGEQVGVCYGYRVSGNGGWDIVFRCGGRGWEGRPGSGIAFRWEGNAGRHKLQLEWGSWQRGKRKRETGRGLQLAMRRRE